MSRIPILPDTPVAPAHSDVPLRPACAVLRLPPFSIVAEYHAAVDLWYFALATGLYIARLPAAVTGLALHQDGCPRCQGPLWCEVGTALYEQAHATATR